MSIYVDTVDPPDGPPGSQVRKGRKGEERNGKERNGKERRGEEQNGKRRTCRRGTERGGPAVGTTWILRRSDTPIRWPS
eukprot:scaffold69443_cov37-Tisochrysis_lutea.AAC.2